jgi:TctA family transporter
MEVLTNIALGLQHAATLQNLALCFSGVFLGTLLGVLPGIGSLVALSLLFPITFHLDPTGALIMMAGIHYGSSYGGSTTSILLNVPGSPSSAVACLDGHPLAKQGKAGTALFLTAVGSFVGASFGIVLMMLAAPAIADAALLFGSQEYFALMVLGLVAASAISGGSAVKGIAMVILGMIIGLTGIDIASGTQRFTFGIPELYEGLSVAALAMGLFGVPDLIRSIRGTKGSHILQSKISLRSLLPPLEDVKRSLAPIARGSGIGAFFGILPGTGGLIASFMSYAVERKVAKDPSRFGKGAIEGLVSPETANNAADMTAFIPTLTLGIPGSVTMAIMLGVLMIHGISPGPQLVTNHPDIFWGLIMSFWIGNIMLLILNLPLIQIWVKLLSVPFSIMYPTIIMLICMGAYSIGMASFDIWMILLYAALGYLLSLLDFPLAPVILGFVLGPLVEEQFRRSLLLSRGDVLTFFERPLSGTMMAIVVALLLWSIWSSIAGRRRSRLLALQEEAARDGA